MYINKYKIRNNKIYRWKEINAYEKFSEKTLWVTYVAQCSLPLGSDISHWYAKGCGFHHAVSGWKPKLITVKADRNVLRKYSPASFFSTGPILELHSTFPARCPPNTHRVNRKQACRELKVSHKHQAFRSFSILCCEKREKKGNNEGT